MMVALMVIRGALLQHGAKLHVLEHHAIANSDLYVSELSHVYHDGVLSRPHACVIGLGGS